MKRAVATMTVGVALDPVPGAFHERDDAIERIQHALTSMIPHYNPVVLKNETFDQDVLRDRDAYKRQLEQQDQRINELTVALLAAEAEVREQKTRMQHVLIAGKHTPNNLRAPAEWCKVLGYEILDADGWRDGTNYDEPLTKEEFEARAQRCTMRRVTPQAPPTNLTLVTNGGSVDAVLFLGDDQIDVGHTEDLMERLIEKLGVDTFQVAFITADPEARGHRSAYRSLKQLRQANFMDDYNHGPYNYQERD